MRYHDSFHPTDLRDAHEVEALVGDKTYEIMKLLTERFLHQYSLLADSFANTPGTWEVTVSFRAS